MPSLRDRPTPGLQLGWIPNDAGRRPRDFDEAAPADPAPDPEKEARLRNARRHAAGWIRMLIGIGVVALALFGGIASLSGHTWFWYAGAAWAALCWLPAAAIGWHWRKAAVRLREDLEARQARHAGELAAFEERRSVWSKKEAERAARAPRWLRVTAGEDRTRLDVFGGTAAGRRNLLTGLGQSLLADHAVIVLDLSHERVCAGLAAAAADAGLSVHDYQLPRDLRAVPLLSGLSGDELASQIVEVTHADDPAATTAGRASDLLVLSKIGRVLGDGVSLGRLHEALHYLLDTTVAGGMLSEAEKAGLDAAFGEGFRREVAGTLIRLAAVVEPLRDLGADADGRSPARLTCLSLADGPRDVTADLTAALIVQWATRSIVAGAAEAAPPFRPAVILAGADEQDRRHLARLTSACDRYEIPLVRTFSRLTEESARHLDSRNTAFMRLATRPEALRAAEHIGLERRFVAARFSISQRVSRSKTRTDTESSTHTTGTSEGGAHTRTTGTTTGEARTETEMPWRHQQVNVNVENHTHVGRDGRDGRDGRTGRDGRDGRDASGVSEKDRAAQDKRDAEREKRADAREAADRRSSSAPRPAAPQRGSSKSSASSGGRKDGKPDGIDLVKSRTEYNLRHASESHTRTWEKSESNSYTRSVSHAVTKGTSVGDEITYELSYEHQVQPETLMDLAEDQMLAPHIAESAADAVAAGEALTSGSAGTVAAPGRMVALVINPALVGSEAAAPVVAPDQIPAYQAPPPGVTSDVPAALESLRRP